MDLWARLVPASWLDRKRWRDATPASRLDAAIALAADLDGVEEAESAIDSLRAALRPYATPIGPRIRWRTFERDSEPTIAFLAEPLRAARRALSARGVSSVVVERAQQLEREVHEAASVQWPERPLLASEIAHAAFVDQVWRAAKLPGPANPVTSLRDLWQTGYTLSAVDASGVTVELPPL